jgi:hypothetical protein
LWGCDTEGLVFTGHARKEGISVADFGVYFMVTNNLGPGGDLAFDGADQGSGTQYDGPNVIPANGQTTTVHLNDTGFWEGAEGTVHFHATVAGQPRHFDWYGSCPVGSASNSWSGPGIIDANGGGHPLRVTIDVNPSSSGSARKVSHKELRAAMVGKHPVKKT